MRLKPLIAVLALLALPGIAPARAGEDFLELPTRPGVTQPFWVTTPPGKPVASVILFTGGPGLLGSARGRGLRSQNFLIRSRDKFAAAGFLVASVDAPSDHQEGLDGFRASAEHAQDIAAVIAYLRRQAPVPVWLIGTSMGTISAANVAARLKSGGADGLVLTSSIVVQSRRAAPVDAVVEVGDIALPTLFVHNKDDACALCPFSAVPGLMARFTRTPRKELIAVSGGSTPLSDPCEALSRHGYIGIEDEVVGDIAHWIKGG
ncbi:MAG TPA: alpha/beta hydrolase [Stellaceae bacterium]|nr:alpha/beta hydrolase [Stellaceae bacterium]